MCKSISCTLPIQSLRRVEFHSARGGKPGVLNYIFMLNWLLLEERKVFRALFTQRKRVWRPPRKLIVICNSVLARMGTIFHWDWYFPLPSAARLLSVWAPLSVCCVVSDQGKEKMKTRGNEIQSLRNIWWVTWFLKFTLPHETGGWDEDEEKVGEMCAIWHMMRTRGEDYSVYMVFFLL